MHLNSYSLRYIAENSNAVIFDNCGLGLVGNDNKAKAELTQYVFSLAKKGYPLFTTDYVKKEILKWVFPYKKLVRHKEIQQNRDAMESIRWKKRYVDSMKKLVRHLEDRNHILNLGFERDWGYRDLMAISGDFCCEFGVSYTDLDFLLTGSALSMEGRTIALISNDNGIRNGWECLLLREPKLSPDKLRFYNVFGIDDFVKIRPVIQYRGLEVMV